MLTLTEKEELWEMVSKEFPSDAMLRDLHFIRALMTSLKNKLKQPKTYRELSLMAREEFAEWLRRHPEFQVSDVGCQTYSYRNSEKSKCSGELEF